MIANNIFRAIGDFFTNVLFVPYDYFRFMDSGWWSSNIINTVFVSLGFIAAFYWLGQMVKHQRENSL
ncbi:uracil phosphoribosyltransferase [Aureibaculum marinum]|uniref:Uracil phosphoribosyltransferase n=1 Tax=Aureibaculum marinum TaxID=2487930 RepID=A0A3N4NLN1_9FLAO|nr:uracil phosphoribosyltransferase [Aureibaculum marinum]RPD96445.1 uracil phosphoribosyltransferase [Aureibaculum marinum]